MVLSEMLQLARARYSPGRPDTWAVVWRCLSGPSASRMPARLSKHLLGTPARSGCLGSSEPVAPTLDRSILCCPSGSMRCRAIAWRLRYEMRPRSYEEPYLGECEPRVRVKAGRADGLSFRGEPRHQALSDSPRGDRLFRRWGLHKASELSCADGAPRRDAVPLVHSIAVSCCN